MKTCGIALTLVLFAAPAYAQEDLDGAIRALAEKLSKEGLAGKLAEAAASDAGVQAIHEKIDFLLGAKIARFERDSVGHFEDWLFTTDANGDLKLRPERQPEIDDLVRRLPLAPRAMSGFSRRADDLVRRLAEGPLEKRAKESWNDPGFRTAFFHRHPELRERDEQELLEIAGLRGLERQKDGRLHLSGPFAAEFRARMAGTFDQLDAVKRFEKSYLKAVNAVADAGVRAALANDTCALFLLGRAIRQVSEGAPNPIASFVEADEDNKIEAAITFAVPLPDLLPSVKELEKLQAELKPALEKILALIFADGTDERNVVEFLKNDRARLLLVERILDLREEQRRQLDTIMNAVLEDGFTADGDKLSVKKGRYVDGEGKDSVDQLNDELNGIIAEFNGTAREDFDRIAERCLDPGVIALFEDRPGTYLLQEFRDRVVAVLADQVRQSGIEVFIRTYLVKQGDVYVVRPERALRVEAILKRATDITAGK